MAAIKSLFFMTFGQSVFIVLPHYGDAQKKKEESPRMLNDSKAAKGLNSNDPCL